ncbi:MAG: 4-hydroxy-tetrahydrodipicolinate reductase [Deltaproteobacteria bacterium]|nr:4-hydroxy-tetrahydrodipicolinate reductase [Deltaproteobacteria bacterium]
MEQTNDIKLAVVGAAGRMGREVLGAIATFPNVTLVAGVDHPKHPDQNRDVGVLAGGNPTNIPLTADLEAAVSAADVAIDFSSHELTDRLARLASTHGCNLVTGTTGISPKGLNGLKKAAQAIAVVASPNMSIGMNLLFGLVAEVVKTLGADYDVEIIEWHHRNKKDAPSGTAVRLAQIAAEASGMTLEQTGRFTRHGLIGPRPKGEIGVCAVRAGDVVGDHTVLFGGDGERIELIHRVTNRAAFAKGAIRAALWLVGRAPGMYDMSDVLGMRDRNANQP